MAKQILTHDALISSAREFCAKEHTYSKLFGVTDGKAVGTFPEHKFQNYLEARYDVAIGSSASGLDLPMIETDIKVTSIRQQQSSCPFRSARQKVYGLGYHLLLFVYDKQDNQKRKTAKLTFVNCAFIDKNRTADFPTTRGILEILERNGNHDDVFAFLNDRLLPGGEVGLNVLADEIMERHPNLGYWGYLNISSALLKVLYYSRSTTRDVMSGVTQVV